MEGSGKRGKMMRVIKTGARFRARISIRAPIPFINQVSPSLRDLLGRENHLLRFLNIQRISID